MAKTRKQKEEIIDDIAKKMQKAKTSVIFNYEGITVAEAQELREKGAQKQVEIFAAKKTLLQRALEVQKFGDINTKAMPGSLAVATSEGDEIAPAKIVKEFSKTHGQISFHGGIIDGNLISVETINAFADLPSKIELLAKVIGSIKAPVFGFVNVLSGNLRAMINVLNAIKNNK